MKDRVIVRVPAGSRASPLTIAEDWLREQARDIISAEVNRQAARMRAKPTGLTIRDQRTRWGSCSGNGHAFVQLATGDGAAGGDAVRGHPRAGASLPAQPFKGFLGGGGQLRTRLQKTPRLAAQERQPAAPAAVTA